MAGVISRQTAAGVEGFQMGEKKRKIQDEKGGSSSVVGDRIEPQSVVPAIDTSNWPLLLKVCQHLRGPANRLCGA